MVYKTGVIYACKWLWIGLQQSGKVGERVRERERYIYRERDRDRDRDRETKTERGKGKIWFFDMTFTVLSKLFYIA